MDSKYFEFDGNRSDVECKIEIVQSLANSCVGNTRQEDKLLEFGMYSICDSLISEGGTDVDNKDDAVSVDDLNNVNKNDLLFATSDSYENILSDNDLLNSVSDTVNLYNETATLYGGDSSKELLFDCSGNITDSNLVSTSNFYQYIDKCDASMDESNKEMEFVTENLENIVPNLNVYKNNDLNVSGTSSVSQVNEPSLQSDDDMLDYNSCNKLVESDLSASKSVKSPVISGVPEANFHLIEFLHFKGPKSVLNNSDNLLSNSSSKENNDNSVIVKKCLNIPKENVRTTPIRSTKVISPHVLTLFPKQTNCTVPIKKLKTLNGLATARLCVKQSDVNEISKSLLSKACGVTGVNNNCESRECINKHTVRQVDKSVQTCESYSTNSFEESNNGCSIREKENYVSKYDKIKRPESSNNVYVFKFSLVVGNSLDSISQEVFKDNDRIHYYTGIPKYSYFKALLNCLNLPTNNIISPFEMLLLTLMKIRLNLDWIDLAYRFDKNVETVKDSFGVTVFILLNCLSRLLTWPMQEYNCYRRVAMNLFVYGIKLNVKNSGASNVGKRIFVCLSNSKHPVHFVSKPIDEKSYKDRLDILALTGIKDRLTLRDIVIFDEEIDSMSASGERSVLLVISKNCKSFCNNPYDASLCSEMKDTMSEIKKYKFISEEINNCWINESNGQFVLFNDVVKVVCGLVNLCHVLPFCNLAVRNIISTRKGMEILIS